MLSEWENFAEGIKSEETRLDYTSKLKFFLEFAFKVKIPRKAQWDEESGRKQIEIVKSHAEKFVRNRRRTRGLPKERFSSSSVRSGKGRRADRYPGAMFETCSSQSDCCLR